MRIEIRAQSAPPHPAATNALPPCSHRIARMQRRDKVPFSPRVSPELTPESKQRPAQIKLADRSIKDDRVVRFESKPPGDERERSLLRKKSSSHPGRSFEVHN